MTPGPDAERFRVLLVVDHAENRRLLDEYLRERYEMSEDPDGSFDVCILDGRALARSEKFLQKRRAAEGPVFLPFLLVVNREHQRHLRPETWNMVDDVAFTPIEKVELEARVGALLRTRRLSLALKLRSDDLEAFLFAMTHDLRAPLRSISGFAEILAEQQAERLDDSGRHCVERIQSAAGEMSALLSSLVEFSRLGRRALRLQDLSLRAMVDKCLDGRREEIEARGGSCEISGGDTLVRADPALLGIALGNLLSNALKYTSPGVPPEVRVFARPRGEFLRIGVADNGIGIGPDDQERIFTPFVRLHGVEDYPGIGLGLSAVRKCAELMSGRAGVESRPERGSIFWIELPAGERA